MVETVVMVVMVSCDVCRDSGDGQVSHMEQVRPPPHEKHIKLPHCSCLRAVGRRATPLQHTCAGSSRAHAPETGGAHGLIIR